jgi:2-polyprenyl-3-methyl-5-hydroxy-6-metoxy-1,4-benzoquinol methylase
MSDDFYSAFEDRRRGSRELIRSRLEFYLPFILPLCEQYPAAPALDLGCGRGEWLEVLAMAGFMPFGVDLDEGMLNACHDLGLPVSKYEAVSYLSTLPENSQAVVSAFHVVEHISFGQLRLLVSEALRVLKPGGLLILETPNPENIIVATRHFYLDPTHRHPIPPDLLSFVSEYSGFKRFKTLRLQESKELMEREALTLVDVLGGASPDYAVVAQKEADSALMTSTAAVFDQEHGLTLETLSARYDNALQLRIQQAEARTESLSQELAQVRASYSWRIEKSFRMMKALLIEKIINFKKRRK